MLFYKEADQTLFRLLFQLSLINQQARDFQKQNKKHLDLIWLTLKKTFCITVSR